MIGQALKHLHPYASPFTDYRVEAGYDADGTWQDERITHWSGSLGPQPDQATLNTAYIEAVRGSKREALEKEYRRRLHVAEVEALSVDDVQDAMISILAEACRLLYKGVKGTATQQDDDRIQALGQKFSAFEAVRTKMKLIEQEIETAPDPEAVAVEGSAHWQN